MAVEAGGVVAVAEGRFGQVQKIHPRARTGFGAQAAVGAPVRDQFRKQAIREVDGVFRADAAAGSAARTQIGRGETNAEFGRINGLHRALV